MSRFLWFTVYISIGWHSATDFSIVLYCVVYKCHAGHQKKLMLAVEKLKRISAVLLRHSTSRHHYVTSSPPSGDLRDIQCQNGGTLKAMRRKTPPFDDYCSTVVPINVCQSTSLLPVTSHKPSGRCSDDLITPTNERFVTSFGGAAAYRLSDSDDLMNTPTATNYFGSADAYNGMVNVNGVCFSVYGTLPRNLIRRHAKQGQGQCQRQGQNHSQGQGKGQGQGQGQNQSQSEIEVEGQTPSDALCDANRTPRRQPAPSPPKRTNSIKTDLHRPLQNDLESTLTRRQRTATPGECVVNAKASDNDDWMRPQDNDSWYSAAGNELPLTSVDGDSDTLKHRTTTAALPLQVDSVSDERRQDSVSENGESAVVLDQEFDGGTIKRRQKCPVVNGSQNSQPATAYDGLEASVHDTGGSKDEVVVLDQEFDGGTVKRRHKSPANVNSRLSDSLTTSFSYVIAVVHVLHSTGIGSVMSCTICTL